MAWLTLPIAAVLGSAASTGATVYGSTRATGVNSQANRLQAQSESEGRAQEERMQTAQLAADKQRWDSALAARAAANQTLLALMKQIPSPGGQRAAMGIATTPASPSSPSVMPTAGAPSTTESILPAGVNPQASKGLQQAHQIPAATRAPFAKIGMPSPQGGLSLQDLMEMAAMSGAPDPTRGIRSVTGSVGTVIPRV